MSSFNRNNIKPIRYCVMDNSKGPVAYVYEKSAAKVIVNALNRFYDIDPSKEMEKEGFCRFAYEDMSQYSLDGSLTSYIMASLTLGFLEKAE